MARKREHFPIPLNFQLSWLISYLMRPPSALTISHMKGLIYTKLYNSVVVATESVFPHVHMVGVIHQMIYCCSVLSLKLGRCMLMNMLHSPAEIFLKYIYLKIHFVNTMYVLYISCGKCMSINENCTLSRRDHLYIKYKRGAGGALVE